MTRVDSIASGVTGVVIISAAVAMILVFQPSIDAGDTARPQADIAPYVPPPPPPPPPVLQPLPAGVPRDLGEMPLVGIFASAEDGVVSVRVDNRIDANVGSGFVYDTAGHVITNAHVVDEADKAVVTFLDGRSYNADIVGRDRFTDIAVIRVDAADELLRPLRIGDSSLLRVGEQIAAIGNPFGLSGSLSAGIVSQLGRLLPVQDSDFSIPDIIQTDAPINPGNSGGPLLNFDGEVVGINTAIQSNTGQFAGVGFAIPSRTMLKVVPGIIADGEYRHPWIGVSGRDIDPDLAGALGLEDARGFIVTAVIDGSPAAGAGMRGSDGTIQAGGSRYEIGGDIILEVDGSPVRKIDDILLHLQRSKSVGDSMDLGILRDGERVTVTLLLDERPRTP